MSGAVLLGLAILWWWQGRTPTTLEVVILLLMFATSHLFDAMRWNVSIADLKERVKHLERATPPSKKVES